MSTIQACFQLDWPGFSLDVDLTLPGHGVTALFGHSGSGKTTLLRCIAGLERAPHGRLRVGDEVWQDAGRWLPVHRRPIGYVFQEASLFAHLSVLDNLNYGVKRSARSQASQLAQAIELLGIGHLLTRKPERLSGGERQRVSIARALAVCPRLLLMDEPLAALDEARKAEILPYLERLRDAMRLPILYVSHSLDEVLRLADTLVALRDGRQMAAGPVAQVLSRPEMLPVVGRFDLGTLLECVVSRHDADLALSSLAFAGGELRVPQVDRPVGEKVRARVRARDVAIALTKPEGLSVSNLLPAVVEQVVAQEGPYADVGLNVGGVRLASMVTRESAARLALRPGLDVWAMVKSVAVDSRNPDFLSSGGVKAPE